MQVSSTCRSLLLFQALKTALRDAVISNTQACYNKIASTTKHLQTSSLIRNDPVSEDCCLFYDSVYNIFLKFHCESITRSYISTSRRRYTDVKLRNSTILIVKGLLTAQISLSVLQQATMFRINFFCNTLQLGSQKKLLNEKYAN